MDVVDMLVRFPRNYYMLRFDKARPLYAFLVKEKGSKTSKIRKLTRKFHFTTILAVFEISKINHGSRRYAR